MEIYVLGKSVIYLCGIFKTLHQEFCVAGNPWWDWWCCGCGIILVVSECPMSWMSFIHDSPTSIAVHIDELFII